MSGTKHIESKFNGMLGFFVNMYTGMALLAFKNSVQDPDGSLKSWDAAVSTNPCSWEGIQCNTVTNVVTSMYCN
jgi:hypothetical protein